MKIKASKPSKKQTLKLKRHPCLSIHHMFVENMEKKQNKMENEDRINKSIIDKGKICIQYVRGSQL